MSDVKRPQACEWWRTRDGGIRYVIANIANIVKSEYPVITINKTGGCSGRTVNGCNTRGDVSDYDLVEHLPDCTGFDWVPVESPDDWVMQDRCEYRYGIDEYRYVFRSGVEGGWAKNTCLSDRHGHVDSLGDRLEIRCRRKDLPPLESPDDWVTQDRAPARPGIDQRAWQHGKCTSAMVWTDSSVLGWEQKPIHGHIIEKSMLHLRCRRKDLPPLPSAAPEPLWQTIEIGGKRYEIREAQEVQQ